MGIVFGLIALIVAMAYFLRFWWLKKDPNVVQSKSPAIKQVSDETRHE